MPPQPRLYASDVPRSNHYAVMTGSGFGDIYLYHGKNGGGQHGKGFPLALIPLLAPHVIRAGKGALKHATAAAIGTALRAPRNETRVSTLKRSLAAGLRAAPRGAFEGLQGGGFKKHKRRRINRPF